jgi:uncharacterized protein (DUF885 family)
MISKTTSEIFYQRCSSVRSFKNLSLLTILLLAMNLWLHSMPRIYAQGDPKVDQQLQSLFRDYHEQFLILFPLEATAFGDPRYNDLLPIDISPEYQAKKRQFYESTQSRLKVINAAKASENLQLAAEILDYEMAIRLAGLDFHAERIPFTQFEGLPLTMGQMGSGSGIHPFRSIKDYQAWLKRMEGFDAWSKAAIENLKQGAADGFVLPKILVERMIQQLLDPTIVCDDPKESLFYEPIRKLPESLSAEDREKLEKAYVTQIRNFVIPAYQRLGNYLRDEYLPKARTTSGVGDLPGGRAYYEHCVRYWTTTSLSPDEVYAIGEKEVARISKAMDQVRQQMGFEGDLPSFFAHIRSDPEFKPFQTPEEIIDFFHGIRARLDPKLRSYFINQPKTPFEIRRTESFREKTASAEYMPGAADGSRPGVFYCPIPDAKAFNITSGMESLFLHEALPGHHYQIALQQENESLPTFARFLWYGAYGEGWALYCESIGEELGMYADPRQKIGALGDEMHRALRLVVDVGLHWKGWTREQAIAYMMANEPLSEEGTIAEVERYMAYPGQALSYKIGQLKISELRRLNEERLGQKFSIAEFHDRVLRDGSMPLSILERRLGAN